MSVSRFPSGTRHHRMPGQMLALEQRYLFDAAALATAVDTTADTGSDSPAPASSAEQDNPQTLVNEIGIAALADLLVDGQEFAISENTPAGTQLFEITGGELGDGFINTQPGAGTLNWSIIGGTGSTAFDITSDGRLIVLDPDQLDYETNTGFTLMVHVTDEFGDEDTTEITVLIGNVSGEAPATGGEVPDQEITAGSTLALDIAALTSPTDDDGDPITYTLINAPEGASIDPDTGLLTWDTGFDQAGITTITVVLFNDFNGNDARDPGAEVDQSTVVQFDVTVNPLEISISDAATVEEGNALVYTVSLNGDTGTAVTADLGFDAGSATGGTDFETKFYSDAAFTTEITSVTLGGGNPASIDIYVKSIDNDPLFNEPDENIIVTLSNIQNADAGDVTASGTLTDSTLPTLSISDATSVEEGAALAYTVSIDGDTATAVTANLAFGAGTATAGSDFETKFYSDAALTNEIASVTLGGGNPLSITVYVKTFANEPLAEMDESVVVELQNIQQANAGDVSASGLLTDSSVPTISISDAEPVNEGDVLVFTVFLSGESDTVVTADLNFGTSSTATAGVDEEAVFYADPGLTVPITSIELGGDNPSSVNVYVKTLPDTETGEGTETVVVELSGVTTAEPADTSGEGDIIEPEEETVSVINDTNNGTAQTASPEPPPPPPEPVETESEPEIVLKEESEETENGEEVFEDPLETQPEQTAGEGSGEQGELSPEQVAEVDAFIANADFSTEFQSPAAGSSPESSTAPTDAPPPKLVNDIVQLIKACGG